MYSPLENIKIKFRIDIKNVLYVNSIMDSYEGVGIVRTLDSSKGQVAVYTSGSMCKQALDVLENLRKEGLSIKDLEVDRTSDVDYY
jgi:transketolase C-terminal domain/subunit